MRERGGKKASFKNGKMSVVPINNLGFSVRQLWGVLWIPAMGLHCSQLWSCQGAQSAVCASQCVCVSAVGAEGQRGILRFQSQDCGVAGDTARPSHRDPHAQPHMLQRRGYNLQ